MEFLEYNKREIQTHLLSLIFVSSLKLYCKEVLFVFFILLKIKKSCKLVHIFLGVNNSSGDYGVRFRKDLIFSYPPRFLPKH